MSKYNTLVNKLEAFEKLAKFGNRSEFLQSLAQENVNVGDKLKDAVKLLYSSIQNYIKTSADRQGDVPGRPEAGLPAGVRNAVQVLVSTMRNDSYDVDSLPALKNAVKDLMNTANLGNIGQSAASAWAKLVFPQASYVADLVDSQMRFLNAWVAKNQPLMDSENPAEQSVATVPVAAQSKKLNQLSKNVSKALVDKVNKLSDGPERVAQLKEVENGVKTLQNYFRRLQNSKALNDYFARIDIVNALNKAYNVLDHKDLQTVVSLSPGHGGVPETPDSKI